MICRCFTRQDLYDLHHLAHVIAHEHVCQRVNIMTVDLCVVLYDIGAHCRHDSPRWPELPTVPDPPHHAQPQFHMHAIAYNPCMAGKSSGAAALLVALRPQISSAAGSRWFLANLEGATIELLEDHVNGGGRSLSV